MVKKKSDAFHLGGLTVLLSVDSLGKHFLVFACHTVQLAYYLCGTQMTKEVPNTINAVFCKMSH